MTITYADGITTITCGDGISEMMCSDPIPFGGPLDVASRWARARGWEIAAGLARCPACGGHRRRANRPVPGGYYTPGTRVRVARHDHTFTVVSHRGGGDQVVIRNVDPAYVLTSTVDGRDVYPICDPAAGTHVEPHIGCILR